MAATESTARGTPFVPDEPLREPTPPAWLKRLDAPGLLRHAQKGNAEEAEAAFELLRRATRKANRRLTDKQRSEGRARLRDLDDDGGS
jgi:hypothetical protein